MEKEIKRFKVTYGMILICLVVYLYTTLRFGPTMNGNEAILVGGFMPELITYFHQYWRFITANFIHFGIVHILVNCYSLRSIGCFIENVFKRKHYLIILAFSAVFTNLLPYLMAILFSIGTFTVSGGISGIIFGLLGSLCVTAHHYKGVFYHVYRQLLPNILLMFLISVAVPSISLYGHLGGFIGGIIGTEIVIKMIEKEKKKQWYN